ncbi:VCBS repeat-containing protein [Terrimonas pollutisoli]|uniref:VCBS repeat-containing protein n=1 Tax=Terrimonas pollutisoli TaxID=3034147 RepID=UPI0023ED9222|nr:VCBS repeat-containing protein [Terrimonas sp. H1YJ31]
MNLFRLLVICLSIFCLSACENKHTLFDKISSSHSGIHFNNSITESDSINPMNVVNIYNGGGVGIGDFNNDGLQDIYLTGNQVSSKLYLNKGDFRFQDITDEAGTEGSGRWARGVAITDINNDGLMDIYICNTIYNDSLKRRNILYINQGINKKGIPQFKDKAAGYGLDINVQSTMAYFFDYDNDGDLDMYLSVNEASSVNENQFGKNANRNPNSTKGSKGRLFQNNWDAAVNHPVFRDVSVQAGVTIDGFGHGATIADINRDGWKDIYVSNDFLSENILFINNHDGTFTNQSKDYFKHTSFNSMGQDIIDINNDGLEDVVELDMNPEDNYRKKMMMPANNYNTFQNFDIYGMQFQYIRNTLQLNQGPKILENDSIGTPVFSEIGFMSGVSQTDWSWAPVVVDLDNDGYRDMIVTNGFPKDVTDHDFIAYRKRSVAGEKPMQMIDKIPEVKLANYAFRNTDGITFSDVSDEWGLSDRSFSNGAAYADFDNDGDMDIIINNIGDEALLYKSTLRSKGDTTTHFLQIKCVGDKMNVDGIGAWIDIYYDGGKHQVYENTPYRGYLSTYQNIAHFGLGKTNLLDSIIIKWPGNKKQTLTKVAADQLLKVNIADAKEIWFPHPYQLNEQPLFREVTASSGISYLHRDEEFIDFNVQTTLPHKLSEYSPALAAGDVDGNGLDDIVIGGNTFKPPTLFLQQPNEKFIQKEFLVKGDKINKNSKDEGILLFDADGDGDLDVYAASGGYKYDHNNVNYQDILYTNDGKGNYTKAEAALPVNHTSKLCVRASDFNKDGKLDLFVSGRVDPWNYPKPVSSFIFRNDTKDNIVKFTDVTDEVAPELKNIGMVCDALFTDFDEDGQTDLLLTGEWMPVIFLKNIAGKFKNVSSGSGIDNKHGWWNSIVAGDFRHTGRTDYIVGNIGLNTLFQPSDQYPVYCTSGDFSGNGSYQAIISLFLKDQHGQLKEFPAQGRDAIIERLPALKKQFDNYNKFATATMGEIFPPDKMKGALRLHANMLQSCFIRNDGNGKFTMIPLPQAAQISALNGMVADDFDGDGNLDVLINGNDYSTEVSIGRYDALNGLLLKGDGKGAFTPLSILQSGIYIPGNGKALVKLQSAKEGYRVAASQNQGPLKLYELKRNVQTLKINPDEVSAIIMFKNDKIRKEEFYYGSSFLSQSARFLSVNENVAAIHITDKKGRIRKLLFN